MVSKSGPENPADNVVAAALTAGPNEQRAVGLRIDDSQMVSCYANAFRANATPEELMLDVGTNKVNMQTPQGGPPEIVISVSHRVVMNYYVAKRLAIMLSQVVRQYEDQYGELELDVAKRRKKS